MVRYFNCFTYFLYNLEWFWSFNLKDTIPLLYTSHVAQTRTANVLRTDLDQFKIHFPNTANEISVFSMENIHIFSFFVKNWDNFETQKGPQLPIRLPLHGFIWGVLVFSHFSYFFNKIKYINLSFLLQLLCINGDIKK